jgi:FkbM family methyltransferase
MTSQPFISYAQNGEDVVLARALRPDERDGFYVDVGAGHPLFDSTTKAFAERGWRGVNIEPVAEFHALLADDRPRDVNLNVAVGAVAGIAKLFVGPPENRGSSTMVPELAESYRADGQEFLAREVRTRTLAQIADEHISGSVDFLKIDVEGMEREVLEGNDWEWFRPRIIVVEATIPNSREPSHTTWEPLLIAHEYQFVLFDGLNRFYVRGDEHELCARLSAPANVFDAYLPYLWSDERRAADALDQALALANEQLDELARRTRVLESKLAASEATVTDLGDALTAAQFQTASALAARNGVARELDALEATRMFRYTAGLRAKYARLRRIARRFGV